MGLRRRYRRRFGRRVDARLSGDPLPEPKSRKANFAAQADGGQLAAMDHLIDRVGREAQALGDLGNSQQLVVGEIVEGASALRHLRNGSPSGRLAEFP